MPSRDDDETPEQTMKRLAFEEHCADIGRSIGDVMPPGVGFAFLMFDFGPPGIGNFAWISNARREDMVVTLEDMTKRLKVMPGYRPSAAAREVARGARKQQGKKR